MLLTAWRPWNRARKGKETPVGKIKLEPIVLLLAGMVVFNEILLVGSAHFFPTDGQTFQVIGNAVSAFIGALLMRVKPQSKSDETVMPPPGGKIESSTVTSASVESDK